MVGRGLSEPIDGERAKLMSFRLLILEHVVVKTPGFSANPNAEAESLVITLRAGRDKTSTASKGPMGICG